MCLLVVYFYSYILLSINFIGRMVRSEGKEGVLIGEFFVIILENIFLYKMVR